jgi:hypothetical protein
VTFEFDEAMPVTVRGELPVPNPRLGVRRALEAAQRARPNMRWRTLVVLLEREQDADAG